MGEFLPQEYYSGSLCDVCYSLFREPKICKYFEEEMSNPEFIKYVSDGRKYYLDE